MALVQRCKQLAALDELFDYCQASGPAVAVISGHVGSGKTAMLQTVEEKVARSGATYLSASCSPTERMLPFGVLDQLLGGHGLRTPDSVGEQIAEVSSAVRNEVRDSISRLAENRPLVIGIDDSHHADESSLMCLLYAIRRLRSIQVLVLLTECPSLEQPNSPLITEFLWLRQARHLSLEPFSPSGVATFIGGTSARRLAADCYRITGGSPALVRSLLEDHNRDQARPYELVPGKEFRRCLMSGLYRCEATMRDVARAAAVLGHACAPELLEEIAGLSPGVTERAVTALNEVGLLNNGRFRHEASRTAVLDHLACEERAKLHARAACILHSHGASALQVAEHLLVSDTIDGSWVVPELQEAAMDALAEGDGSLAVRILRLAHELSTDEQRVITKALLAQAEWQIDPATATRHLPELALAASEGRLADPHATMPTSFLLWHGHVDAAVGILDKLSLADPSLDLRHPWLTTAYPERFPGDAGRQLEGLPPSMPPATANQLKAGSALHRIFTSGPDEAALIAAEQILESCCSEETNPAPLLAALVVLICADHVDRAAYWCDRLFIDAEDRGTPTQRALFAAGQAMIGIRRGDLGSAERYAQLALTLIPVKSWGVGVGVPLASALLAATAMADYESAANVLREPVPMAMFETPVGLLYLHARGRYYLATNRCLAALDDFQNCGELMTRWGFDTPGLVPWRTEAAKAYMALGRHDTARTLLEDELARLKPDERTTRGVALRILADLSEGDSPERRHAELSDAELRVAALAAQGHTNRQIAGDLFITVSTVEQHLTRVYRKLHVRRRSDLPLVGVTGRGSANWQLGA